MGNITYSLYDYLHYSNVLRGMKVYIDVVRKVRPVCVCIYIYSGCPRRNVPDFGRVFLMLKYTDITQNTYVQS
jgi:hypothetical protein